MVAFTKLNMMFNFQIEQYPELQVIVYRHSQVICLFLERHSVLLLSLIGLVCLILLLLAVRMAASVGSILHWLVNAIIDSLRWNGIIDTFIQSFLITAYNAMMAIRLMIYGESSFREDWMSPFVLLLCMVIGSRVSLYLFKFDALELQEKQNIDRFGSWYIKCRIYYSSPRETLWWPTIFLTNRLIYCFVTVLDLTGFVWLQVTILIGS